MKKIIFSIIFFLIGLVNLSSMSFGQDSLISLPILEELVEHAVNTETVEAFLDTFKLQTTSKQMKMVEGLIHHYQGEKAYDNSEWESAGESYLKALSYFRELNDSIRISTTYNNLGIVNLYQAFYDKAVEAFQASLAIDLAINNRLGVAKCYQNIALVLETNGQFESGINMYRKALDVYVEIEATKEIASVYNNIGACYAKLNNLSQAQKMYMKALELFQSLENFEMEARVFYNMGVLLIRDRKYDEAARFIEKSLVFFKNNNDKIGEISAYNSLADLNLAKKEYNKAIFLYSLSNEKAQLIKYREMILHNFLSLYSTFRLKEDWKSSLENLENYVMLKDSIKGDGDFYDLGILDKEAEQILMSRDISIKKNKLRSKIFNLLFITVVLMFISSVYITLKTRRRYFSCRNNYNLQNKILSNRINPNFILSLLQMANQLEVKEHKEIVDKLIYNIVDNSTKPTISLKSEIEFIKSFVHSFQVIHSGVYNISLVVEDGNIEDKNSINIPSMASLFYLNSVISENVDEKNLTIKVALIKEGKFLKIYFEDDGLTLSERKRNEVVDYYVSLLEYVCKHSDSKLISKNVKRNPEKYIDICKNKTLKDGSGNFICITLPIV